MSQSDRKAYRRHPRVPVDMMINKFVDDQPYMVRVKDISMSGVYFHKLIEPRFIENEDSEVGLELRLPGSNDTIWAAGRLIRESSALEPENDDGRDLAGCGIEFTDMADEDRARLQLFISEAMRRPER